MDIYQKLQDLCNRKIEKGRQDSIFDAGCLAMDDGLYSSKRCSLPIFSYHDLFSADSGFMESLEWKDRFMEGNDIAFVHGDYNGNEEYCEDIEYIRGAEYYYMMMGPMTATEKIQYVLDNVVTSEE